MLKIKYPGIQYNAALDVKSLPKDIGEAVAALSDFREGVIVSLNSAGFVKIASGAKEEKPLGFLVRDAGGYWLENVPALGSHKVAVAIGNCVVETDQIDATRTYVAGESLYVHNGILTNDSGAVQTPAKATTKGLTITFAGGAECNGEKITFIDGSEGAPIIDFTGTECTIQIKSGETTQQEVADALLANHPRVASVEAAAPESPIEVAGDETDSITAAGGSNGEATRAAFGVVTVGATPANPVIEVAVV